MTAVVCPWVAANSENVHDLSPTRMGTSYIVVWLLIACSALSDRDPSRARMAVPQLVRENVRSGAGYVELDRQIRICVDSAARHVTSPLLRGEATREAGRQAAGSTVRDRVRTAPSEGQDRKSTRL